MKEILITKGFTSKQAENLSHELSLVDARLEPVLDMWLQDGIETDYSAEGYTIMGLKQQYSMTYPAALLSIDWLLKEPEIAKECINKGLR
jgi:hypothetical protein